MASKNRKPKPKPKKVKARPVVVKRETEVEDIGPQFKAKIAPGVEITIEEHKKIYGTPLIQRYKTNPEVEYSDDEEEDEEYVPEE